jgi:hypothetical protein
MAQKSFKKHYCSVFEMLGYPLSERMATPPGEISSAEERLGARVPAALRDYYAVAGRERRFNHCLNRLLTPGQWSIDKQHLLFMEENQSVLWWGASVRNQNSQDPPISQGINDDPIEWHPLQCQCSVSGGYDFYGSGDAPDETDYRFEAHGWTFHGEINSLTAYSRPNEVICLMPPDNLPFMKWSVLGGAKTERGLKALSDEIGVSFPPNS